MCTWSSDEVCIPAISYITGQSLYQWCHPADAHKLRTAHVEGNNSTQYMYCMSM